MFDTHELLIYLATIFAFTIVPGPSVFLVVEHGLKHGAAHTQKTIVATLISDLIWMSCACFGIHILFECYPTSLKLMQCVGAIYLLYLGWKRFTTPIHWSHQSHLSKQLFKEGFLVAIANPKTILFFAALFPLFVDYQQPISHQLLMLGSLFLLMAFIVLNGYALAGRAIRIVLSQEHHQNTISKILGLILMGFAFILFATMVRG